MIAIVFLNFIPLTGANAALEADPSLGQINYKSDDSAAVTTSNNEFEKNLGKTGQAMGFNIIADSKTNLYSKISNYITVVLSFLGVIFLIIMIYAGYLWMTAEGDKGQVDKAKKMITQAVVGLIIVVSAYTITAFVGYEFNSGVTATDSQSL